MARFNGHGPGSSRTQNGFKSSGGGSASTHMPNGGSNSFNINSEDSADYASNEMHYKMCKKIAQLTKVIYTLNTKADEHETVVEEIESKHETQMNKFFVDCEQKLTLAKSKIEDQKSLKDKILSLEAKIEGLKGTKDMHEVELKKVKSSAQDEITKLKISHSNTILNLGKEVETLRDKLETQTDEFSQLLHNLVKEKEKSLEEVRVLHDKTLETLKFDHKEEIRKLKESMSQLESPEKLTSLQKELQDMQKLKEIAESSLLSETEKLRNQHDDELEKLRNDLQLEAMQATRSVRDSLSQKLQSREQELNSEIERRNSEIGSKIKEIESLKQITERQKMELSAKHGEGQSMSEEFNLMKEQMGNLETENTVLKNRADSLTAEVKKRDAEIQSLKDQLALMDKSRVEWEMKYEDGVMERNVLEEKNRWLEGEVDSLTQRIEQLSSKMGNDTVQAQKELEDLRKDLESKMFSKESELKEERDRRESELQMATFEFEKRLHEERSRWEEEMDRILSSKTELQDCKQEYEKKISNLESNFEKEQKILMSQIEKLQAESAEKLQKLQGDLQKKSEDYSSKEKSLRVLEEKIGDLQKSIEDLQSSLELSKASLAENEQTFKTEKNDWELLRSSLESSLLKLKQDHAQQLIVVEANLNNEWKNKLEAEMARTRELMSSEQSRSVSEEVNRVQREKEEEIERQRQQLQHSINTLQQQIVDLEQKLADSFRNAKQAKDNLEGKLKAEKANFEKELREQKNKGAESVSSLQKKLQLEISDQIETSNLQLQLLEQRLNEEHLVEMERLKSEMEERMKSGEEQAAQKLTQQMELMQQTHYIKTEQLRNELMSKHKTELDKLTEGFNSQINHLKQEIAQINTLRVKMEKENNVKLGGMKEELSHRNSIISSLEGQLSEQKENMLRMGAELEFKDKVVHKIRAESEESIRKKQTELESSYKLELDNLQAEKLREQRRLLDEFSRTREVLQGEIRDLKAKLREAEERYERRESRPEDMQLINRLQQMLEGEEEKLKRLAQEKEFFQRELVNRETNFNKVFNSSPNVGVLNPLAAAGKGKGGAVHNSISGKGNLFTANSMTSSTSNPPSGYHNGYTAHQKMSTPPPGGRLEPLSTVNTQQNNYRTPTPPKVPKKFL